MITVTVYNTAGASKTEVKTNATTWGELQLDLTKEGVTYEGMKAILGGSHLTLDSDIAALPTEDFKLFLSASKVKSGNSDLSYEDAKDALKAFRIYSIEEEDEDLLALIGNYSNKNTSELNQLIDTANDYIEKKTRAASNQASILFEEEIRERIFAIEYKLNIINRFNKEIYDSVKLKELQEEWNELKKTLHI